MNLDQEKRVMLAFALSIVMLVVYRVYFVKEPPPPPKKSTATTAASAAAHPGAPGAPPAPAVSQPVPAPAPAAIPVLQGAKPEDVVVESQLYRVTFSTQGAVVKDWVLKKYRDALNKPLDTVNVMACETLGSPMSVNLPDSSAMAEFNQGIYVVKAVQGPSGTAGPEVEVHGGAVLSPPLTLNFTYSNGKLQIRKQFFFDSGYESKVTVRVFDGQHDVPVAVEWPGGFGDQTLPPATVATYSQGVYGSIGDLTTVNEGKVKVPRTLPGPLELAGLEDKFFAGIFLPETPDQVAFKLARHEWSPPEWTEKEKPQPLTATLDQTQPKPLVFHLFVGPKALDVLKAVNPPLDSLVDFGWFSIVAKPLFIALRYIYDHWIHNYGWAIVLLTILINMAMFPLKVKSLRSAQEMQKVQPIVKGIQDKYKQYKLNDPRKQKMNEEVMKVYSEHGINPFGSCLPMLLQMPLLYGFYRVLDLAIELRHAPWFLWVRDLSAPDRLMVMGLPIPVLVILMTIASFILQRMTPMATVDPSQQRMMMLMPLVFAFMFFKLPSGMVLYWFTSSVVQIIQQVLINRRIPPANPLPVPRKAAEAKG